MANALSCAVCEKHENLKGIPGGVVFKNEHIFVAHFPLIENGMPAHYGHLIIELRRHITNPALMTEQEAQTVGLWIQKLSRALEQELGAEHVYIFRIGDKTPHLHFHLVPRFSGTPKEVWGTGLYEWAGSRKATPDEMKEISDKIRSNF